MKRYYNDEPEPDDFFSEEEMAGQEELMRQAMMAEQGQLNDLQLNVLAVAITFLSAGFFWKFKSYKTKLKEIREVYQSFIGLLDPEDL